MMELEHGSLPAPNADFNLELILRLCGLASKIGPKYSAMFSMFSNGSFSFNRLSFSDSNRASDLVSLFANMLSDNDENFVSVLGMLGASDELIEFLKRNKEAIVMLSNGVAKSALKAKMMADFVRRFKEYKGSKMDFILAELKKSFQAWDQNPTKEKIADVLKVVMVLSLVYVAFSIGLLGVLFLAAGLVVEKVVDNRRTNKQKELMAKFEFNKKRLGVLHAEYNKKFGKPFTKLPESNVTHGDLYNEIVKLEAEQNVLKDEISVLGKNTIEKVKSFVDYSKKHGVMSAFKQFNKYDLGLLGKFLFFGLTLSRVGISGLVALGIAVASRVGEIFFRNKGKTGVMDKIREDIANARKVGSLIHDGAGVLAGEVANKIVPPRGDQMPESGGMSIE